ncbi:MAG: LLM class flavin-dependent oxidoreductase [Actinobacteria bacterium]|nr:LLM class flavin-dependent oxidoreductase [Actinomycetota bacterium]
MSLPLEGIGVEETVELAKLAESNGYTDIWSAESGAADGLTPLAAISSVTSKVRLGTAILPVYIRPPALLAMSASSMQMLSGGRFVLGIGTSSSIIIEKWMGMNFEAPLKRMRETVAYLREALGGKKVDFEGDTFKSRGFRLGTGAPQPVPIYIGALGPRMLRLAGEIADGVVLWLFTPDGVKDALYQVRKGAASVGRDPDEIDVVARIVVAMDEDAEFLKYMLRRTTTTYAMVDVYNRSLARQGFETEAAQIAKLWAEGDREGAANAVTDEMLSSLYVAGDKAACVTQLQRFREAGVKTPVVFPVSVAGEPSERLAKAREVIQAMSGT